MEREGELEKDREREGERERRREMERGKMERAPCFIWNVESRSSLLMVFIIQMP